MRTRWVANPTSTCSNCKEFDKVLRMVTAAENALERCSTKPMLNEILKIRCMEPKSNRLEALIKFAAWLVGDTDRWPKPVKNNKKQYQQYQRDAARRFANSVLVVLPGNNEGPDAPLTKTKLLTLELKSKAMCPGNCQSMDTEEEEITTTCPTCTHLRQLCTDEERCKACGYEIGDGDMNPCLSCQLDWLMENNNLKDRLA